MAYDYLNETSFIFVLSLTSFARLTLSPAHTAFVCQKNGTKRYVKYLLIIGDSIYNIRRAMTGELSGLCDQRIFSDEFLPVLAVSCHLMQIKMKKCLGLQRKRSELDSTCRPCFSKHHLILFFVHHFREIVLISIRTQLV